MIGNARGIHTAPGIYSQEVDLSYAAKSLGITSLALAGETLKGPAFEPISISDYNEFVQYFGGTSPEKFIGSKYPKYELPYIAKSYLNESNQLEVCRVLGLSGYNAGPAWLITASKSGDTANTQYVVAVLRSTANYGTKGTIDVCSNEVNAYDRLSYDAHSISMDKYTSVSYKIECENSSASADTAAGAVTKIDVNSSNYGRFCLVINGDEGDPATGIRVQVSLNPGDKDYILSVLGSDPLNAPYPVFVEELYDVAYAKMLSAGKVNQIQLSDRLISGLVEKGDELIPAKPKKESVVDILESDDAIEFSFVNAGQRYLVPITKKVDVTEGKATVSGLTSGETYTYKYKDSAGTEYSKDITATGDTHEITITEAGVTEIEIRLASYEVKVVKMSSSNGRRLYKLESYDTPEVMEDDEIIFVDNASAYFKFDSNKNEIKEVATDLNDYKEMFRCASTPWVVSEIKGDGLNLEVKKLFRFHTISDGNAANQEVKVSIMNIKPDDGTFDVLVRSFDDMDSSPKVLERFTRCSMVEGSSNFIGLKIGTFDGEYMTKSKYITVEVNANDMTEKCVPAGFLGYPMRDWGEDYENPSMGYNCELDIDTKAKRQFFGFSNITGIDVDLFNYKGRAAYNSVASLSDGFHLDGRIELLGTSTGTKDKMALTVDGESGFKFSSVKNPSSFSVPARISSEAEMRGSMYGDDNSDGLALRKFTVCFYGGFDGWDIYRTERTTADKFKANKYMGSIVAGVGNNFSQIKDGVALGLSGNCITSDYYAYLAGAKQFANPESVAANVFATPGIDYVNQNMLSSEILSMVEEERGDCLYIMITPDKPSGAEDSDYYAADEAANNLNDSGIDSSYAATYFPWVKYYDSENNRYINLSPTKDVVAALAYTDRVSNPWFAPAGTTRGNVDCEKAHIILTVPELDTLYEARINPLQTFAVDGVKIWAQKTMYDADTPLNRINVRRLMLRVKQLIVGACKRLVFEQNSTDMGNEFKKLIKPILNDIKSKKGIYDYQITVDDSAEARDRLELPAAISIKPTKALEYIDITFTIMPESVSFDKEA